ncbi:glycosyltransferase family 39 protein [Candidatus Daviesbacteria bacterium]|nr:glycosyltransferase family 39 protein [Candidatus Daviesbacteria bacterium]
MIFRIITKQYFWLLLILIGAFYVRLYRLDAPLADWHSWRQADTAAVTRNFVKLGFNPLMPKYDDMSGVSEHPLANPTRFRFVEFPIYNMIVYPFYSFLGINIVYDRLVSIFFSLWSLVFVYLITRRYTDSFVAIVAAFIFAFLPYNVYFSRTILPEPTFVFFALGMLYFVDRWIREKGLRLLLISLIFTAIAYLIKPWAIFFSLPLLVSFYNREKKIWPIPMRYWIFVFFALAPFMLWRFWILQQPEGIPASNWLLNGDGIRFRPAFFWWIISERIGREILGAAGAILFYIGIIIKPKSSYFLHAWLLSAFLFMIVVATGNVRHDYYQISFIPIASVFTALGFSYLLRGNYAFIARAWTIPIAVLFFVLMFYFGWLQVKGLYQINNPVIIEAGKKADHILPKEAVVVAPYNGDTAFLYQVNRPGWPVVALPLADLIQEYGVTAYVSTTKDAKTAWVMRHFKTLENNSNLVIVDLTKIEKPMTSKDPEPSQ